MSARLLILALFGLSSCTALDLEFGQAIDMEFCDSVEPGLTHRAEVMDALGPPVSIAAHVDGVALLYEHVLLDEDQLGFGLSSLGTLLGASWLGLFKIALGGSTSQRSAALFVFDAAGILSGSGAAQWEEEFGRGGNLQLFVAVDQVVDSGSLRELPRGLTWGLELCEPLPEMLNQAHRADLELRGSPDKAGQQTLQFEGTKSSNP